MGVGTDEDELNELVYATKGLVGHTELGLNSFDNIRHKRKGLQ